MKRINYRPRSKGAGSRVLIDISLMVIILFLLSSAAMYLFFRQSQSRLVDKSKEKLVENIANQIWSTNGYTTNLMTRITMLSIPGATPQSIQNEVINGIQQQTITPPQEIIDEMLVLLVENGFYNSEMAFYALPSLPGFTTEPMIIMSSDPSRIYNDVPPELVSLAGMSGSENTEYRTRIDGQNSWMLSDEGIPEFGLDGEYLATAYKFTPEGQSTEIWYFNLIPMHEELGAIDSFYNTERRNIDLVLILVMAGSIIALALITFFILSYMIRVKITRPIGELSDIAEKVMEGNIDIVVPAQEGEEFYGLKMAFNDMLSGLRRIIHKSPEDKLYPKGIAEEPPVGRWNLVKSLTMKPGGRSSILFRISIILIAVFVISGVLSLFFFQQSEVKLVEKSKEKIVQSIGITVCSGHYYMSSLINHYYALELPGTIGPEGTADFYWSLANKVTGQLQQTMNDGLKDLVDQHFNGLVLIIQALDPMPGILDETTIVLSTDDKYMYMKLPDELEDLFGMSSSENTPYRMRVNEDDSFMLAENGIPSMGIKGEYLVTAYRYEPNPSTPQFFKYFSFKPMARQLVAIDDFYDTESSNVILFMGVVILVDIIAVLIITLFVLNILIKLRITKPVDELAGIAEQVMDGNLDIEVPIRKGEEFESLKTAFNEMLVSLRELISQSNK